MRSLCRWVLSSGGVHRRCHLMKPYLSQLITAATTTEDHQRVGIPRAGDLKILRAAIIGAPNAGKSTLVNQLLGKKVFAVSPKVHTTRTKAMGVFTEGNTQVILLDTPGVIPYKYGRRLKMTKEFLTDPFRSLMEADIIVVIVDASNKRLRESMDPNLVHALRRNSHAPSILILNKVDLLRHKRVLLYVAESLTGVLEQQQKPEVIAAEATICFYGDRGRVVSEEESQLPREPDTRWPHFKEVFMVSALTGDGVADLRSHLVSCAVPGRWEYSEGEVTDLPGLVLVEDIVREKLFLHLQKEIPYTVTQDNVVFDTSNGKLVIYQNLNCKSSSQASIVIGPRGSTIQTITAEAKDDIAALFKCDVDLTINVRTRGK